MDFNEIRRDLGKSVAGNAVWAAIFFLATSAFGVAAKLATTWTWPVVILATVWFGIGAIWIYDRVRSRPVPNQGPRLHALSSLRSKDHEGELRRKAEALAKELLEFVSAQRKREPDLGETFSLAELEGRSFRTYDPTAKALGEYAVQFKARVAAIYGELGATSAFEALPSDPSPSNALARALSAFGSGPADPTTLNEIVGLAFEIEVKASKLAP